jgi:ABC-type sugar transport system substrate-binding protein
MQALRKEPRERFFDVNEMVTALEPLTNLQPGTRHLRDTGSQRRPSPRRKFWQVRRYQVSAGAFLAAATALVGISLALSSLQPPAPALKPMILASARGTLADAVPSVDEVARAKEWLGSSGKIGYIACGLDSQFETQRSREMSDRAADYGISFQVYNSKSDPYRQLTLIEQARLDHARALIVCPLQPNALADSLASLRSSSIPFVLTDVIGKNSGGVMLDPDNAAVGALAGQYIGEILASAAVDSPNIVILDDPDYSFSGVRVQGFMTALTERVPTARLAAQLPSAADPTASYTKIHDLLANGQKIDAIFSIMDVGAYGAISALNDSGIDQESIMVVGVNAESFALNNIYNQDFLRASVDIDRYEASQAALDAAIKLLGGGMLPETLSQPPGQLITRDTLAEQSTNPLYYLRVLVAHRPKFGVSDCQQYPVRSF